MLRSLTIQNFALIDQLHLEFGAGLNILTGETGAGKSIILDAIDAVLGGKVTARMIRTGCDRSLIEAGFEPDESLTAWLTAEQIDPSDDGILICAREITHRDGRLSSRSRVNGVLVNRHQMDRLRDRLVEITAQGQTVQLSRPNVQRDWLDGFGGAAIVQQKQTVAAAYNDYRQAKRALEHRQKLEQNRQQLLDQYEHELRELRAANLDDPQEWEELEQERHRLSHAVELRQQSYQVYQALYQNDQDGDACADLLGRAEATLMEMQAYDPQVEPILSLVSEALAQVEEAGRRISLYGDNIEADPERLQEVEERIQQLKQIGRKYGPTLAEAIAYQQRIEAELADLQDSDQSIAELAAICNAKQTEFEQTCARLTELRQAAARHLEARLVAELAPLAMDRVQFQASLTPALPGANGADQVTFVFSPNPGEPLQPLTETASGGEMSRFLLALKTCFSQVDEVGTLIFDEIDVGVSGKVAQAIADKLFQISTDHQVLCVTHQPMVAAMANVHFRVDKQVVQADGKVISAGNSDSDAIPTASETVRTIVRITPLNEDLRRRELAQLAGGQLAGDGLDAASGDDPSAVYAFADSLLAKAYERKQAVVAHSSTLSSDIEPQHQAAQSRSSAPVAPEGSPSSPLAHQSGTADLKLATAKTAQLTISDPPLEARVDRHRQSSEELGEESQEPPEDSGPEGLGQGRSRRRATGPRSQPTRRGQRAARAISEIDQSPNDEHPES